MREQIVTFGGCLMDTTVTRMKKMEDRSRLTLRYNRQNRYIDPKLWCSKKNPPPKNTIWLLAGRDSLFI